MSCPLQSCSPWLRCVHQQGLCFCLLLCWLLLPCCWRSSPVLASPSLLPSARCPPLCTAASFCLSCINDRFHCNICNISSLQCRCRGWEECGCGRVMFWGTNQRARERMAKARAVLGVGGARETVLKKLSYMAARGAPGWLASARAWVGAFSSIVAVAAGGLDVGIRRGVHLHACHRAQGCQGDGLSVDAAVDNL